MEENIEKLIQQILWGKYIVSLNGNRIFCFRSPTIAEKNHAEYIYNTSLELYKAASILTGNQLIQLAKSQGEWTEVDENYYNNFDELLSLANEQLAYASKSQQKKIKKQIKKAKKTRKEVLDRYNTITCHSAEQQAMEDKVKYYIACLTEDVYGIPIWKDYREFEKCLDYKLIMELIEAYFDVMKKSIDTVMIRKIARSSVWRVRWNIGKKNIHSLFGAEIRDLNDLQLELVYWSQVYDSVYNSIDTPPDSVIEDDKKLDAWLKERHKEDNSKRINKSMERKGKRGFYDRQGNFHSMGKQVHEHKEIGMFIDGYFDEETGYFIQYTEEEKRAKLEEIYGSNAPNIRRILAAEQNAIKNKGALREEKLRKGKNRMLMTLTGQKKK